MCIYCDTGRYRKIYKHHYGEIPKDAQGKKFHIHHRDGNHLNNDPTNLIALSEEDHYRIHLQQGDYGGASRLAKRLFVSAEERSQLARDAILNRMAQPNYVNPSTIKDVRKKQSISGKIAWDADDGTRKKAVIAAMTSKSAQQKRIKTLNDKSPLYHLSHLETGCEVIMTRYDFNQKFFEGKLRNFNDMVPNRKTGKTRSSCVKGWKLLKVIYRDI